MISDDLRDDLAAAERAFETTPEIIEDGLGVDDPSFREFHRASRRRRCVRPGLRAVW